MATSRKIAFSNGELYHVFNRGVDRREVFTSKRDFYRAQDLIKFYRHQDTPIRYSQVMQQPEAIRDEILRVLYKSEKIIDVLSYCLMPNHFHFLVKQNSEKGVATFISKFTNAYTKYFNTKYKRVGPLFQGVFKAVLVESDEQLIHLSRYIHLNPTTSSIIENKDLNNYLWSSYKDYLSKSGNKIVEKDIVLGMFKSTMDYELFVLDQIDYAKQLDKIKHLALE